MLSMELAGSSPVKTKKKVYDESMDLSIAKEYRSRRQRGFDDSNSEDEGYI